MRGFLHSDKLEDVRENLENWDQFVNFFADKINHIYSYSNSRVDLQNLDVWDGPSCLFSWDMFPCVQPMDRIIGGMSPTAYILTIALPD